MVRMLLQMFMYMLYAVVYSLFGFKHNVYIFSLGETLLVIICRKTNLL
jgi:hypothetical protein